MVENLVNIYVARDEACAGGAGRGRGLSQPVSFPFPLLLVRYLQPVWAASGCDVLVIHIIGVPAVEALQAFVYPHRSC